MDRLPLSSNTGQSLLRAVTVKPRGAIVARLFRRTHERRDNYNNLVGNPKLWADLQFSHGCYTMLLNPGIDTLVAVGSNPPSPSAHAFYPPGRVRPCTSMTVSLTRERPGFYTKLAGHWRVSQSPGINLVRYSALDLYEPKVTLSAVLLQENTSGNNGLIEITQC